MKPGIYPGLTFEEYRAIKAVNWHTLQCLIEHSPYHARYEQEHGTDETEAMAFGSLTDFVLLEPARFQAEAVVEPEIGESDAPKRPTLRQLNAKKPSPESVRAIEFWRAWDAANAGKIIVTRADYDRVMEIGRSVRIAQCADYVCGGQSQVSLVWEDGNTGLLCKARLDYHRYLSFDHVITDLKTCRSARDADFQSQIFRLGYDGQMAFYHDGWAELNSGEKSLCFWLAAEKQAPFVCKPWQAHELWLQGGRNLYRRALERWNECVKANDWPAYGGAEVLGMPGWAQQKRGIGPDLIWPEPVYTGGQAPEGQEDEFDTFLKGETSNA